MPTQDAAHPLPLTVEDVTREWLETALQRNFPAVRIEQLEIVDVIWGTATKVRVLVRYADPSADDGPPEALCIKACLDERIRALGMGQAYRDEAMFFGDIAPRLDIALPRCWFADVDAGGQGLVILDDLIAHGCTFKPPTETWSPDQVSAALEVQASWHGPTWSGNHLEDLDWLKPGSPSIRSAADHLFDPEQWALRFDEIGDQVPRWLENMPRLQESTMRLWEIDDASVPSLSHGDPHPGNTYFDSAGQPHFLDWQCVGRAPVMWDVTYFLVGALSIDDRRTHERDLIHHYLTAFHAAGGTLSFEDAWTGYRQHQLHGVLWFPTPIEMQPLENTVAVVERYAAGVEDHDSFTAVGVS